MPGPLDDKNAAITEREKSTLYRPGQKKKTAVDKRTTLEKSTDDINQLYDVEMEELTKAREKKNQKKNPAQTTTPSSSVPSNTSSSTTRSTQPNKLASDELNRLSLKDKKSWTEAQRILNVAEKEEVYDERLQTELVQLSKTPPAPAAHALKDATQALNKLNDADKKATKLESATKQGIMASLDAGTTQVAKWFLGDSMNTRTDFLAGRKKYFTAVEDYKNHLKEIETIRRKDQSALENNVKKTNAKYKEYADAFKPDVVKKLEAADPKHYPSAVSTLSPEEVKALENVKKPYSLSFSSMRVGELLAFWKEITDKKNNAEQAQNILNAKIKTKEEHSEVLEQNILDIQGEIKTASRPDTNSAITELAKAVAADPDIEKDNPALARLHKVLVSATRLSTTFDKLDKEQAVLQLRTQSRLSEWREKYVNDISSSEKLTEGHEKFIAPVKAARKNLIKLKEDLELLKSKLTVLDKSIEEELKVNDQVKPESSEVKAAKTAVKARLEKVRKQIQQDAGRIDSELKAFETSLGKIIQEANKERKRKQIPDWSSRVAHEWKAGSKLAAVAAGIAGLTLLPSLATSIARRTYADEDAPLVAELTKDGKPVKLVRTSSTDITKTFTESGSFDISAEPSFFIFTDSARRQLVLKFIGQCIREGLVQTDKNGKRTLKMLSITNDEYRATLVVLLGQLGISPVGPAMDKPVYSEPEYNNFLTKETKWNDEKKEKFFLQNPQAQDDDPDKAMANYQFHLLEEGMGYTQAGEYVFKEKGEPTPGGIKLAELGNNDAVPGGIQLPNMSQNNTNPSSGGVQLAGLAANANNVPGGVQLNTKSPAIVNFNMPNGNGSNAAPNNNTAPPNATIIPVP